MEEEESFAFILRSTGAAVSALGAIVRFLILSGLNVVVTSAGHSYTDMYSSRLSFNLLNK